jgi:magnesium chelatase family protein
VEAARKLQRHRLAGKAISCNARFGPREIQQFIPLDTHTQSLLKHALTDLNLSARAYHRVLKVARTIADLAGSEPVTLEHVSEAIQYRSLDRQIWG